MDSDGPLKTEQLMVIVLFLLAQFFQTFNLFLNPEKTQTKLGKKNIFFRKNWLDFQKELHHG